MRQHFHFALVFLLISSLFIGFSTTAFAQEKEEEKRKEERTDDKKRKKDKKEKGELERFKDREKQKKVGTQDTDHENEDSGCAGCLGDILSDIIGQIFIELIKATFDKNPSDPTRFLDYPYAAGEMGFANRDTSRYRWGFGQMRTYYQRVDNDVDAMGFSMRGRLYSRTGLSLDYTRYREQLSTSETDHLNIFRLGLMKSVFINEWLVLDLDFGVRTVDEFGGLELGIHSQFFSRKPFVQDFWGSIGKIAGDVFGELNASVGVMVNRFQVEVGYRMLKWGDEYLTGGQVGLRLWF